MGGQTVERKTRTQYWKLCFDALFPTQSRGFMDTVTVGLLILAGQLLSPHRCIHVEKRIHCTIMY